MNEIPQADGNIWGFLTFVLVVTVFVVFKFKDKITTKIKEYKEKK
jgi:hypothetical protein